MSESMSTSSSASLEGVAGWYGKLPSLGDFAARRLSDAFIAPWDAWLAERIAQSQVRLGVDWLARYLTCPVWRFFAMPGAIHPNLQDCWMGVLMASVDRVGRHFPLTVAAAVPSPPITGEEIGDVWHWLGAIESVALAALEFDHGVETLDAQLAALPVPRLPPCGPREGVLSEAWQVASPDEIGARLAAAIAPLWQAETYGMSLWTAMRPRAQAQTQTQAGTPDSEAFTIWPACGLPDNDLFTTMLQDHAP